MKWIKHIHGVFEAVRRWNRAADYGANGQYERAFQEIVAAEKLEAVSLSPDFLLLKAVLARLLGNPTLAVQSLLKAHEEIGSFDRYSEAEKRYLECFASVLGLELIEEQRYREHHRFVVDYASVDLAKVTGATKKVFPLRSHPAWGK